MRVYDLKRKENLDFSVLSERILLKRTDRPDEWSMDELASMALKIETRVKELESAFVYGNATETHLNLVDLIVEKNK